MAVPIMHLSKILGTFIIFCLFVSPTLFSHLKRHTLSGKFDDGRILPGGAIMAGDHDLLSNGNFPEKLLPILETQRTDSRACG